MEASANGVRARFTRNLGNIVMDLDDVEAIRANTLGGTDRLTVNDLSGTDVVDVRGDLALAGGDDLAADNVIVNATSDDDVVPVTGSGPNVNVLGLAARVTLSGARRQRPADGQGAGRRRPDRRVQRGRQLGAPHAQRR
jgi:hypothetical protein